MYITLRAHGSPLWQRSTCRLQLLLTQVLLFPWLLSLAAGIDTCLKAQSNCMLRHGCQAALSNYYLACSDILYDGVTTCDPECRSAIIALLSTVDQDQENLMTCDCGNNTVCQEHRHKLDVCSSEVLEAMESLNDDSVPISCALAQQICNADTSCTNALEYYQRNCALMFLGDRCTDACNNSLSILYRQAKARKLQNCYCDGEQRHLCERVRRNTEHLCLSTRYRHHHGHNNDGTVGHTRSPHRGRGTTNSRPRDKAAEHKKEWPEARDEDRNRPQVLPGSSAASGVHRPWHLMLMAACLTLHKLVMSFSRRW